MGYEDHKKDYLSDLWRGRRWQVGSRRGETRRASAQRFLGFERMDWRGRSWQVGHVTFAGLPR